MALQQATEVAQLHDFGLIAAGRFRYFRHFRQLRGHRGPGEQQLRVLGQQGHTRKGPAPARASRDPHRAAQRTGETGRHLEQRCLPRPIAAE